jgi:aminopeptidase YwaD
VRPRTTQTTTPRTTRTTPNRRTLGAARWAGLSLALGAGVVLVAQEREDRTLLTQAQMTAIINEASGERAMHHVLELVPYQRVRKPDEYKGHFRESDVMAQLAKDYGFSNVTIESFAEGQAWQPTVGELWMTAPRSVKLYDVHDIALSLASLNANGDVSGDLIDVGAGRAQDFEGKDVKGKFVLASTGLGGAYAQAVQRGALGAIAVSSIGVQRTFDFPDQIVSTTVVAQPNTAAWAVSPNTYRELQRLLNLGQTVTIRSVTKSEQVPTRSEIVHAEIPGDGSTTQEVAIGGHLYEGVIKQGANDDNSGCALTLEIGRAYLKLINEGKLPRPKRTINFQWLAEISGTNAWLNAHPDKAKKIIGDLNFDMEGIRLATSRSYWILQRTPDTFPSYINDIAQSMMEYVADVSRERVRFRANGYAPVQPIVSPNGSSDAFYIKIDKHYGSSDHVTYMQHGIPAVMFITWPDMWYHSSGDTPDKQDPTQYKRAAVVGTGALAVLASGTDEAAARVLSENVGRGLSRMGESHVKGLGYLADAATGPALMTAYKEARTAIAHQAEIEKGVVRSASVLWTNVDDGKKKSAAFEPLIDRRATTLMEEVKAAYQLQAAQRGVVATEPTQTAEEREAANLLVERVGPPAGGGGGGGGRGAGGGGGRGGGGRGAAPTGPQLPQEMNAEFNILIGQNKTALEIRDFLSGEFTPLPLADLMAVLRARETAGSLKLTPKPAPPTKPAPRK